MNRYGIMVFAIAWVITAAPAPLPLPMENPERLYSSAFGIDYGQPEKYLAPGEQTRLSNPAPIAALRGKVQSIAHLGEIYYWIKSEFTTWSAGGKTIGQITTDQLFAERRLGGCHDWGLVYVSIARELGYPAVMVETAGIAWAKRLQAGQQGPYIGHVFVEVFVAGKWVLVDSTNNWCVEVDYDPANAIIPLKLGDETDGFFVLRKGVDTWDYRIRSAAELNELMEQSARGLQVNRIVYPPYLFQRLLAHQLIMPILANRPGLRTGFALTNDNPASSALRLTAYDNNGIPLPAGSALNNPLSQQIPAGGQLTRVASEGDMFGTRLAEDAGWTLIESQNPLSGFFLLFDDGITQMDGTGFSQQGYTTLVLPDARNSDIVLINTSGSKAAANISLLADDGIVIGSRQRILAPRGRELARTDELFAAETLQRGGYLRISANQPLVGAELLRAGSGSLAALGAFSDSDGARTIFSPQYAVGGGIYKTILTILNMEKRSTRVIVQLVGGNGQALGNQLTVNLQPLGRAMIDDPRSFGLNPNGPLTQGYVRMESDTTRILGAVRFGDPNDRQFHTALPFVAQGQKTAIYSQVAQNDDFFTGMALVNPGAQTASVTVAVYDTEGRQCGAPGKITIPAGQYRSQLLSQMLPDLPPMSRGYFRVISNQPLFSFAVFGTHDLSALAAIPAQPD